MGDSKRFKTHSVAKIRQLLDDHPFQSTTGRICTAPFLGQTGVVPLMMISPSGRRMRGSRPSQAQNRTLDEMEEQIEASRQNTLGLRSAGDQRRHVAFKSIERYWDYQYQCTRAKAKL